MPQEIQNNTTIAPETVSPPVTVSVPPPELSTINYPLSTSTAALQKIKLWFGPIIFFVAVVLLIYSVRVATVTGGSMEPSLHEGSRIVIDKFTPRVLGLRRGDVIVFRNPKDAGIIEVKRVIGLPGELVLIEGGTISATPPGGRIQEFPRGTYVGGNGQVGDFRVQLGPQEYFVLGDNRSMSTDSRAFGAVRPSYIVGRVIYSF